MSIKWKWSLIFVLLLACWGIGLRYDMDLVTYWFTARFAHYDLTRVYKLNWDLGPYFYGPVLLPFLEPFATMGYPNFKMVSMLVDTFWFLGAWYWLFRLFPLLASPSTVLGFIVVWILSINPFHQHFQSHQMQIFLFGVVVLAEYLRVKPKPQEFLAGFLLMFAGMAKLFPGVIVLYYLALWQKQLTLGLISGFVFSLVLPLIRYGVEGGVYLYREFLHGLSVYNTLPGRASDLVWGTEFASLPALVARQFQLFGLGRAEASYASVAIGVGMIAAFLVLVTRDRLAIKSQPRLGTWYWSLACALAVFLFPGTRTSYFMFILPSAMALFEILKLNGRALIRYPIATTVLCATVAMAFTTDFVIGKHWNNILETWSIPTYGLMLFVVATLWALATSPQYR